MVACSRDMSFVLGKNKWSPNLIATPNTNEQTVKEDRAI